MNIHIAGINDPSTLQTVKYIVQLFFEQVEWTEKEESELSVVVSNHRNQADGFIVANLQDQVNNQQFAKSYSYTFEKDADEKDTRKKIKRTLCYTILSVFETYTGMKQPWGILTGIRPMKLYHQRLQQKEDQNDIYNDLRNQYVISDEKIMLMDKIAKKQLAVIPDLYELKHEVSIYIGIPFCPTKCAYCTFPAYAITGKQGSVNDFLTGLQYEMEETGRWLKEHGIFVTTVYFGGGTPTSISASQMDALYETMHRCFPMSRVREVTVEAGRPDTITVEKLNILKKWHIDRISINPQSYTEETLKAIGRHHTVKETIEKYNLAREYGMNNINMDLIIGLPNETIDTFAHSLQETKKLMPESVTVHTLSFKRASTMTKNKEKYKVAIRDDVVLMMKLANQWTSDHGYHPYYVYRQKNILGNQENVGYSLPEKESIYNILIMEEMQTILGLGCGAASKFVSPVTGKITRFANPKEPKAYNENYRHYTEEKLKMLSVLFQC